MQHKQVSGTRTPPSQLLWTCCWQWPHHCCNYGFVHSQISQKHSLLQKLVCMRYYVWAVGTRIFLFMILTHSQQQYVQIYQTFVLVCSSVRIVKRTHTPACIHTHTHTHEHTHTNTHTHQYVAVVVVLMILTFIAAVYGFLRRVDAVSEIYHILWNSRVMHSSIFMDWAIHKLEKVVRKRAWWWPEIIWQPRFPLVTLCLKPGYMVISWFGQTVQL